MNKDKELLDRIFNMDMKAFYYKVSDDLGEIYEIIFSSHTIHIKFYDTLKDKGEAKIKIRNILSQLIDTEGLAISIDFSFHESQIYIGLRCI